MTFLIQVAVSLGVVGALIAVFLALGNVLPVAAMAYAISITGTLLAVIYEILPLTTLAVLTMVGSLLTVEGVIGLYKVVKWVYSKLPGIT